MTQDNLKDVRDKLNKVSPSFCLAKWSQVTIHLQSGMTHSCHHPNPHKIPLDEIEKNPDALHNTRFKMLQRKSMLQGVRPKECGYCWGVEDADPNNYSDRTIKSSQDWALPDFDKIKSLPSDARVNPTYLEVSFGYECHFKCAYCAPNISSSIMNEYQKFGHYKEIPQHHLDHIERFEGLPISKNEKNPYNDAFWEWWPTLKKDLKVFRITGGEPLLAPSTTKLLEELIKDDLKDLDFALNSNFSVSDAQFDKFIELSKKIVLEKKVKKFEVYTSVDTFGAQAEYIRFGLDYKKFLANVRKFLTEVPEIDIIFMVTYNALSVSGFHQLLEDVLKLKNEFIQGKDNIPRVKLDIALLRTPHILNCRILTLDFLHYMEKDLEFMRKSHIEGHQWSPAFYDFEILKMERLISWFKSDHEDIVTKRMNTNRKCFDTFLEEYDKRKKLNFDKVFPEYKIFRELCKSLPDILEKFSE